MNLKELTELIKNINIKNGWITPPNVWEDPFWIPAKLMLIVSEVSEAVEGFRNDDKANFEEELADIVIRTLDMASRLDIDIEGSVLKKLEKNSKRSFKHGGKKL